MGFGVEGNLRGPFDIVGVVRPVGVGVVLPVAVGVVRPVREGVTDLVVAGVLGVDNEDRGGVGVTDRPNAVVGVGVVDRPNGCRGLIYRGVPLPPDEGVRGLVGVVMLDEELLRRLDLDKLPDEPV